MYVSKGLYTSYADYIDTKGSDLPFFKKVLEVAKETFYANQEHFESASDYTLKSIKKSNMMVMYGSTVTKQTQDDIKIVRTEMNDRVRRRYLILDADYDKGEEIQSEATRNALIQIANAYETPLLIYPTPSYPEKPRFRAVLFVSKLLTESTYYQAMSWLYESISVDMDDESMDKSNFYIRSNNNAPFFTNEAQISAIYNTMDDESLKPLDNDIWKSYPKPRIKKVSYKNKRTSDEINLMNDEFWEKGINDYIDNPNSQHFETFWQFYHSLARAEFYEQITTEQAYKVLDMVAKNADEETELAWKLGNRTQYPLERSRVFGDAKQLERAKPILEYPEFTAYSDIVFEQMITEKLAEFDNK